MIAGRGSEMIDLITTRVTRLTIRIGGLAGQIQHTSNTTKIKFDVLILGAGLKLKK